MSGQYEAVKAWRALNKEKVAAQATRYKKAHPEVIAAKRKRWREKHREELLPKEAAQARARRAQDPEGQRRRNQAYLARQLAKREVIAGRPRAEVCELCGVTKDRIVFDHCHISGKFRAWICDRCNKVFGLVYDSPELLRMMADYLEEHRGKADNESTQCAAR